MVNQAIKYVRWLGLGLLSVLAACAVPGLAPEQQARTSAAPESSQSSEHQSSAPVASPKWSTTDLVCKVWNSEPEEEEVLTWSGACSKDGYAHGSGQLNWFVNGKPSRRYVGQMRQGRLSGRGEYFWVDGSRYKGDFDNGEMTGRGEYHWASGDVYQGDFLQGKLHGKGEFRWVDGNSYKGDFVQNGTTGQGEFRWANGNSYKGDFVQAKRTGKGEQRWADGGYYKGDFDNDELTGRGERHWPNGNSYKGDVVRGKLHGKGEYRWATGEYCKDGQFDDDAFSHCQVHHPNGELIGAFVNNEFRPAWTEASRPQKVTEAVRPQKAAAKQDAGGEWLGFLGSMVGAVAQGLASGGGKNAAMYQALADVMNTDASTAVGGAAGAASANGASAGVEGTPMKTLSRQDYPDVDFGSGAQFSEPVNQCVGLIRKQVEYLPRFDDGRYVSMHLHNKCSYPIQVHWCAAGKDALDHMNQCQARRIASTRLQPGEKYPTDFKSISTFRLMACRKPFVIGGERTVRWEGEDFRAACFKNSKQYWDAPPA